MIDILFDLDFLEKNTNNKYSYPYNPTGFEIAYVLSQKFGNDKLDLISKFINLQFDNHFNFETLMFSKNNEDPNTLTARLYELIAIRSSILKKIFIINENTQNK